jgi:hypothetical protein
MERRQKGEQFRILEAAFPAQRPSSPNRPLVLALGLILGLAVGAGVALLAETIDRSFHGVRQIQATLAVPVLAAVPKLLLASDKARLQRRRLAAAILTAGIAGVVLLGAGAGYMAVNGAPGFVKAMIGGEASQAPGGAPAEGGGRG